MEAYHSENGHCANTINIWTILHELPPNASLDL